MKFKQFLELKFLEWQSREGGRKTVAQFARYLGVGQSTVSMWWNSDERVPEGENLRKIAEKLGIEVYDVLGLPRPDADLLFLQSIWNELDPNQRRTLREQAEKYKTRKR